ncbi:TIGR03084 family protein [Nocardioides cavernaquae]|uniref:TIGR03084 family protein n=2 Tax=Nocardioides cavernaquae TaxID=2321396 RepID=A0A3A5HBC8_9ACTN|nr:TIGR03084 family protein [Nocardioides cavernaquae]
MKMSTLHQLLSDLVAETAVLDDLLAGLRDDEWETATPAEGWAVRDQVSHLAFFDEAAVVAATNPERFRTDAERLKALGPNFPDVVAAGFQETPVSELNTWFRNARSELIATFAKLDGKARMPWFGPDMSVTSCVTARLMETWAHTQDVLDAFGVVRKPTMRLRHVAHLGVRTMHFSFHLNGRPAPEAPVHVSLKAPDGSVWSWGPEDSHDRVEGDALDFCLVVTQRRNVADTGLVVSGPVASEWLTIAQAYAGAPGPGREPLISIRSVS